MTPVENGHNSSIAILGDTISKTTHQIYPSLSAAIYIADGLLEYAHELGEQPLRIAPLLGVEVIPADGGYAVRHTYELIDGPRMNSLPQDKRQEAVATVLRGVADMDGISAGDPDTLCSPIDAKAQNFHVDSLGPALIDISPALTRLPNGEFPLPALAIDRPLGSQSYWPYFMGTRSGVMTRVLFSSIDKGEVRGNKLLHDMTYALAHKTDDWCYDVIPRGLAPDVEKHVRLQIRTHFLPFIAMICVDRYGPISENGSMNPKTTT
jgi:hypothetical protein